MNQVTVFSTTTCKYCKQVKDYLSENNVAYEEVLLDEHPERIQESVAISGSRGVPVTRIVKDNGKTYGVLGWDQPALAEVLEIKQQTIS